MPGERPRQILAAALEVFGEHGLAAARLEDIAKHAGVSKGTIYLYFPNKEELFREMIRDVVVGELEQAEQAVREATGTATEILTDYVRGYWERIRRPQFGVLYRLIHAEIRSFPDLARFYGEEVVTRGQRILAGIIERGIERGEFRSIDPLVAARMLSAPLVTQGLWCSHRECFGEVAKRSDAEMIQDTLDFFLHAMRPSSDGSGIVKE